MLSHLLDQDRQIPSCSSFPLPPYPSWPRSVTLNFVFPPRPETGEGEAVLNKINRAALEYRGMFCLKTKQKTKEVEGRKE